MFLFSRFRVGGFAKALSISVLNQVVSSGTGFVLGLYLVRVLEPVEYGLYGIGFALVLLYAGFGNALFLTQMVVHSPDKKADERAGYAMRMLVLTFLFGAVTSIVVLLFLFLGEITLDIPGEYVALGMATLAASISNLFKTFFVRHSYSIGREIQALKISSVWSLSLFLSFAIAYFLETDLSSVGALWLYAFANILAAVAGQLFHKLPISSVDSNSLKEDFLESFHGGRWAVGGVSVTWLQSQAYMYITALFLGPVGVAFANAGRLLVAPFSFLLPALNMIILPRLAETRKRDTNQLIRFGGYYTLFLLVLGAVYAGFLMIFSESLITLLLGERYDPASIEPLIAAWCFVLLWQLGRNAASQVLQALKDFKSLMLNNVLSAILAIFATWVLIQLMGAQGAILGTGIGEMLLMLLLWKGIRNAGRNAN